jgi:hypothetical protein
MIIRKNDKMLVSHRRLFEEDLPRFFTGVVEDYEDGIVRINGFTWQHELIHGEMIKKPDRRNKIISVSSGLYICYLLPEHTNMESLFINHKGTSHYLTDGEAFTMDLTDRLSLHK